MPCELFTMNCIHRTYMHKYKIPYIKETCSRWKMPKAFCLISGVTSSTLLLLLKREMNVDIQFHIKQTLWHPRDERWMLHSMLICSLIKYMMRIFVWLFFSLLPSPSSSPPIRNLLCERVMIGAIWCI